ncbi:MAG: hypothetical protein K2Y21_15785 [Phycisphaerales bacterium]|nr:hypothetical protein [Phycisphaerales bacterium]
MRRVLFWFWTLLGLAAACAAIGFANVLAERYLPRLDVTATGEHRLSPRATTVLAKLESPARLVIATDLRRVSPEAMRDTTDVLDRFSKSGKVEVSLLDSASADGLRSFQSLLRDLTEADKPTLDDQAARVRATAISAVDLAKAAQGELSTLLLGLRDAVGGGGTAGESARQTLEQRAAAARLAGRDLQTSLAKLEETMAITIGDLQVTAADRGADLLKKQLRSAGEQMGVTGAELRRLAKQPLGDAITARAANLAERFSAERDRFGVAADALSRVRPPASLRLARALAQNAGAILLPPAGAKAEPMALPLDELFPESERVVRAGAKADNRRRVEEQITAALAATLQPARPIAVFTHAEEQLYVADAAFLEKMRDHLSMRGMDFVEWSVLLEAEPSQLSRLDPSGQRPVVYVVLPPDSTATARASEGRGGIERSQRLGAALEKLLGAGKNVLLSVNPSIQRTYGDTDPVAAALKPLGIEPLSGKPIMTEVTGENGRGVETDRAVLANEDGASPIHGAIRGLPTYLPWPIGLTIKPESKDITRLITLTGADNAWGESRWLLLWQTPRQQRARLGEMPKFDAGQDERGPWTLAAVVERANAGSKQRVVVVGSSGWFFDTITQAAASVDGRVVAQFPGNMELFDASVLWLTGGDELIAQSPQADAVPLIGAIDPQRLLVLRLLLILGVPLTVLALGVVHRVVFG